MELTETQRHYWHKNLRITAILLAVSVLQSGRSVGTAGGSPTGRRLPANRGESN